jgi:antitoxin (DNA-binding transcriptional repressor) of toxin-antitoxin stability system
VILTERGKPVAVIRPLAQDDSEDAVIRRLEAEGLLRPALKRGPMPEPRWKPIRITGKPVSETIREERDE